MRLIYRFGEGDFWAGSRGKPCRWAVPAPPPIPTIIDRTATSPDNDTSLWLTAPEGFLFAVLNRSY
jgi:hypothetical protein